jgi:hypothetical protein
MPVIGLNYTTIEARKEGGMGSREVKVNSTPMIKDIKEVQIPNLAKKALSIDFEFFTRYDPAFASIKIEGKLMYLTPKNKEVLTEFGKSKRLPEDVSMEVLNYLFRNCLLKASILADDLQLPPPMPMPKITPKKK